MPKKPCHLGHTYDPTCIGCEAVNEKEVNYVNIGRTVGCAHCDSQLTSLPEGMGCLCTCHEDLAFWLSKDTLSESEEELEKGWEEEFDRKFSEDKNGKNSVGMQYIDAPEKKLKDFIHSLLSSERSRVVNELYRMALKKDNQGRQFIALGDIEIYAENNNITLSESEEGKE